MDEIHSLKLDLEKFKNSFEENGVTLTNEKLTDKYSTLKQQSRRQSKRI